MFMAKIYNGNKGTTSEYYTVIVYEANCEMLRAIGKYFKTFRAACNWAVKHDYKIIY